MKQKIIPLQPKSFFSLSIVGLNQLISLKDYCVLLDQTYDADPSTKKRKPNLAPI